MADAYGLKVRDGEPRRPTLPIAQCLTPLNTLVARLDNIQSEATKRTGRIQTDGTHVSSSEDTSNAVHRITSGLKSLQHNVHGLIKEDDVLVRSTVTDVNEHFHAEMRKSFESGMTTPLQFHKKLFPVIDASVRCTLCCSDFKPEMFLCTVLLVSSELEVCVPSVCSRPVRLVASD